MNMKKIIGNGFLFLISMILMYLLVFGILFVVRQGGIPIIYRASQGLIWEGGGTYEKFQKYNPEEKYDIIILGSSHAYRGYDPRNFASYDYKTFNLGSSDQSVVCSYYIAKNYLHHNNCKMVILDMYDRVYAQQNIESYSDIIQNVSSDKTAIEIALAAKDIRSVNMLTLRMFSKFTDPINKDTIGFIDGFKPTFTHLTIPEKKRLIYKYETNQFQLNYLDQLLSYLEKEKIKIIVAEHPLPSCYQPEEHQRFRNDILPIFEKHHLHFYDYCSEKEMTGIQYFADDTHLSVRGARMYNQRLIKDLIQTGELKMPDHPIVEPLINFTETLSSNVNE